MPITKTVKSPMSAIRAKCLECSGGSSNEVRICPVTECSLWRYRMGKRPETLEKRRPELLDPEWVKAESAKDSEVISEEDDDE